VSLRKGWRGAYFRFEFRRSNMRTIFRAAFDRRGERNVPK
jgi:hypothetical protein